MPTIVTKRVLNPTVTLMEVDCPAIARKAKPGQFVMVRSDPMGERIPLTIADYDAVRGTVTIMYQRVGLTTQKLDQLNSGDDILDMVGPLGNPTEVDGVKRAVVIGGGVGCAQDVVDAANAGASAVATAALLHYKKATVPQLKADIRAAGVEVRV